METSRNKTNDLPAPENVMAFLEGATHGFWLDSGLNVSGQGRFSFYGQDPFAILHSTGEHVTSVYGGSRSEDRGDPFELLCRFLDQCANRVGRNTQQSCGGLGVGYIAYDAGRFTEPVVMNAFDDLGLPEIYFTYYTDYFVIDHKKRECTHVTDHGDERTSVPYRASPCDLPTGKRYRGNRTNEVGVSAAEPQSNFSRNSYLAAIREAKEYIAAGDIYQVNLSQRFSLPLVVNPGQLYLTLREDSPAPFGAYLKFPDFVVLSNSPERFLRYDPVTRKVQTRPIKGTRPRGCNEEEDRQYARELMSSEKDRAENIMIVDLERNDLGRVCETGSVRVTEQCKLESFPTVYHLTSTVDGILAREKGLLDLLRATFPGGSITGAPKIRAMQIIDELEPTRRGVYTGCIGYVGADGSLELNIAIRTAIHCEDRIYFQVGGGIVADSDPDREYEETLTKALAWQRAIAKAQRIGEV